MWRSLLYVPVNVPRFVEKAQSRGADALILDLEDSVPDSEKHAARSLLSDVVARLADGPSELLVRVNRPLSLAVRDIEAAAIAGVRALVLPKAESGEHVRLVAELVAELESERGLPAGGIGLVPLVETPGALLRVAEIAAAPGVVAISIGPLDLALEMEAVADADVLVGPMQQLVVAARAAGVAPIGIVGAGSSLDPRGNTDGYAEAVSRSRRFGFAGAACVHPTHVAVLNEGFRPSLAEIEWARRALAAYDEAMARGRGSVAVDGRMVDAPVAERARRTLAQA